MAELDKLESKKGKSRGPPGSKVSKIIGKRLRHPEFVRLYLTPLKSDSYADKVMQQLVAERADKDEKFNKAVQKSAYKEVHQEMAAVTEVSLLFEKAREFKIPSMMLEALDSAWARIRRQHAGCLESQCLQWVKSAFLRSIPSSEYRARDWKMLTKEQFQMLCQVIDLSHQFSVNLDQTKSICAIFHSHKGVNADGTIYKMFEHQVQLQKELVLTQLYHLSADAAEVVAVSWCELFQREILDTMKGLKMCPKMKAILPKVKGIGRLYHTFAKVLNVVQQPELVEILGKFLQEGVELTAQDLDGDLTQIMSKVAGDPQMLQSVMQAELHNLTQLRDHVNMLLSVHPNARGTVAESKVTAVINEALASLHE